MSRGIGKAQRAIVAFLERQSRKGNAVTRAADIARATSIRESDVYRALASMERRGYAVRVPIPESRTVFWALPPMTVTVTVRPELSGDAAYVKRVAKAFERIELLFTPSLARQLLSLDAVRGMRRVAETLQELLDRYEDALDQRERQLGP
jgi:sugar-specific transcriptional regulator TrmB